MRHTAEIERDRTFTARLGDRSLFPHLEALVYLNHAAASPPSRAVRQAVIDMLDVYSARGAFAFPSAIEQRSRLRGKLARLIHAATEDIALVLSTTVGIIDVALCFPWRPRDRVILFTGEFPANVTPWQRAAELFDLELTFLPLEGFADGSGTGLERLEGELRRGARLVAVSAVQFQSGLRMPLAAIGALCRAHGAELSVDAVQACGAVPVDVEAASIDYLACGGHKWLMGLEGTGFLYVRRERVAALRPHVAGWLSHEEGTSFLSAGPGKLRYDRPVRKRADFVEGGNLNTAGYAGLEAALDLILDLGVETIYEHANRYVDRLEAGLKERGFESLRAKDPAARSCALGVRPPDGTSVIELHRELGRLGISCSTPDGVLRFAPHWPNDPDEVDQVLLSVDEGMTRLRK
jgi:cysteine desulfurase / selenocysteine lyase